MFSNAAAEFVYYRTYSRWIEELKRRENWSETVTRYITFIEKHRGDLIPKKVLTKIEEGMLSFSVMPSMRAVWAAGSAAEKDNTVLYNCSFSVIDSIESFAENLYVLMCGTGWGYSVEYKYINKLPEIPKIELNCNPITIPIEDDRAGWADSVKSLIQSLYTGNDLQFDYSLLRPKGARLNTMGGRSSGPEPLISLHNFIRELFVQAQGRKLKSIEVLDICNKIAEIVVVGGVRRSSEISLSDIDDKDIRDAKIWPFPLWRAMSNNSAVYYEKPKAVDFLQEWSALAASGTGERGISNLGSTQRNCPERRKGNEIKGFNPCHEIALRDKQFCNLSEVVIRLNDDLDDVLNKIETATWIGVIQSTFTYFPYLSKQWKKNCEEERLLGVSLTGQMDAVELMSPDNLRAMKKKALKVAKHAAEKMDINVPAAITCVKPSGTVSQLVDSSSGLHPRYSDYYIRRYRIATTDPLFKMLQDQKVPMHPENGQTEKGASTWVLEFPVKSPNNCITRSDIDAIKQLEHYKMLQQYWCEHNASATIYVKDEEWFAVGNWVYQNWDYVCGVSFLPYDGGRYELAPYEEITKDKYEQLQKKFPKIDYTQLSKYEMEDNTEGAQNLACVSGVCEI